MGRPQYTPEKRLAKFWSRIDKTSSPHGCWLWTAGHHKFGYGNVKWGGRQRLVHRLAWEITYGPIPEGQCVLHNCPGGDNPACCNPAHLFLGTKTDNNADRDQKGRTARGERSGRYTHPEKTARSHNHGKYQHPELRLRGEKNGRAKITDAQAVEIRQRYAAGGITQKQLGQEYGLAQANISQIILGKHFHHLE